LLVFGRLFLSIGATAAASLVLPFALAMLALLPSAALADDQPVDIVRDLYDSFPHETDPPGGMARWTPEMQALWQELNEKQERWMSGQAEFEGEGLSFDFLTGTQESFFDDLKIKIIAQIEYEGSVLAVLNNGAEKPYALRFGFLRDEVEGWQIMEIWHDDAPWALSELIQETR